MKLKLAVIGDPIAHSKSPELQRGFLAEYGLEGTYEAIEVPAGTAAARIDELRSAGYHGLNVTTPLKEEAYARAEERDAAAGASGAANTLVLGAQVGAYNTDGLGARGALAAAGLRAVSGRRVLILGTGPTARAAAVALLQAAAGVLLWNRTPERAASIARAVGGLPWTTGARVDAVFSTLPPHARPADEAVLATVQAAPLVIDANYGARATLGALLGRSDVHDGSAMLLAGARASFEIFRALA